MADTLRWALLSTAHINRALIEPLKGAERSELAAVASRDAARATEYARQWAIPQSFGSYEEMLADPSIDAVYISLPNNMHAEWTLKAAQAGKHVLCEKPLVVSLDEMAALLAAERDQNVVIFEAFMYLHHPQTRQVKQWIESGRIGTLQTIHSWFHFNLPPEEAGNVRLHPELAGGALWDVGVYPNSLSIVMTGGKAPEEVWAQGITGESGVDVAMRAQLRFGANVTAQISCGFRTPFREGAWFVGDRGIIQVPEPWKPGAAGRESRVTVTDLDDSVEEVVFPAVNPYACEIAAMEACVLDGAAPVVPLRLSYEFARSVLAIYESAATGRVVAPAALA
jgi:predicted dehydrogenase